MAHWIISDDQFCTCSNCRHVWDDTIDHVSDDNVCPNCKEEIHVRDWLEESEPSFRYQLLDRMRQDCEYYLGNGGRSKNALWAEDEKSQIQMMRDIWNSFPDEDKPEWLTWEQIEDYAQRMGVGV